MPGTKVISVSAPSELIEFLSENSISASEIFQMAARAQRDSWIKCHIEADKLREIKAVLEKMNCQHWDYLHEKGLEADFNKWKENGAS